MELEKEVLPRVLKMISTPSSDPGIIRQVTSRYHPVDHPLSSGAIWLFAKENEDDCSLDLQREKRGKGERLPFVNVANHHRQRWTSLTSGGGVSLRNLKEEMDQEFEVLEKLQKEYESSVSDLQTQISDLNAELADERASSGVRDASQAQQVRTLEERLSSKEVKAIESQKKSHEAFVTSLEQHNAKNEADQESIYLELENA
jgi:ribosomal protein L29